MWTNGQVDNGRKEATMNEMKKVTAVDIRALVVSRIESDEPDAVLA
jgi:hypothetical protein